MLLALTSPNGSVSQYVNNTHHRAPGEKTETTGPFGLARIITQYYHLSEVATSAGD
jgi:hypothetical protein